MNAQIQLHDDIRAGLEAHAKLPLEERLERLREIGILNADLQLSERYGGKPVSLKSPTAMPAVARRRR